MSDDLVLIGRVVKPHGIRGEVVVDVLTDVAGRLDAGEHVRLGPADTAILSSRPHQGRLLVAFEGVGDRTAAEGLRGAEIRAEPADYEESDVYFAHELVGMAVRTADGRALGVVSDLVELPDAAGYDLLEVELDGTTWLLPAVDEYVRVAVDADGVECLEVVDAPAGLLPGDEGERATAAPDGGA